MTIRGRASTALLWLTTVLLTFMPAASAAAGPEPIQAPRSRQASGQASGAPRDVTVTFVRKPRHRRARNEASLHLSEYVIVEAVIAVNDRAHRPVADADVTLSAMSDAGVFKSGRRRTNARGEAAIEVRFNLPPGSLGLSARACLSENSSPCTVVERISLRDWVDFGVSFDVAILTAALPGGIQGRNFQPLNTEFKTLGVAALRPQVNLWEAERQWRYYRVSLYGNVPFAAEDHGLGYGFGLPVSSPIVNSYESLDATAGLADWSAGIEVVARGILFGDIAYNSRSGKVNHVDALQSLGEPRLVDLGDGFESIDSTIETRAFVQPDDLFVFVRYANSHAFLRPLSAGRPATRGDVHDVTGGLGLVVGESSAFLVWGGYRQFGAFRVTRGQRLIESSPTSNEYVVGLSRIPLTRRRARPSFGFTAGGLGTETRYFGLSFSLNVDVF